MTLCKKKFCLFPVKNLQTQLYINQNTIDFAGIIYFCQKELHPSQDLVSFDGMVEDFKLIS